MNTTTEYAIHFTQRLRSKASVELFFDKIQNSVHKLLPHDILELILQQDDYPIKHMIPNYPHDRIVQPVSDDFRRQFYEMLSGRKSRPIEALSYHDLFRQLSGNPTSIMILAACYSNPFCKFNSLA